MMDAFQRDIITIIRSALTGMEGEISDVFELAKGIKLAKRHNIVAVFYEGVILCGISASDPLLVSLKDELIKNVFIDTKQRGMINALMDAFEQQNIDYLPMKGILLKQLYPRPEMRTMGDADILIKLEQYSQIKDVLEGLRFEFKFESDHELAWSNSSLFLELHKSVIAAHDRDLFMHSNTGWTLAEKVPGFKSKYAFKPEDFYIYLFVHFTKHYRTSGIGIKHMIDLWVYKNAYPQMDWKYIGDILERLNLLEFYQNVIKTLEVWFEADVPNYATTLITNVVFSSGQYGTTARANINRTARDTKSTGSIGKTKMKHLFVSLFLPYDNMKGKYPILAKIPILLPIMWLIRWIDIAVAKRKNVRRYMQNLKVANKITVDEHLDELRCVGLDFKLEE